MFVVAQAFGLDPFVIMHTWSERQFRVARAWLSEQWNKPNRLDHYLMRVAQRVQQANSKEQVTLEEQKIKFTEKKQETMEERVARSKAIWKGGVRMAEQAVRDRQRGYRT